MKIVGVACGIESRSYGRRHGGLWCRHRGLCCDVHCVEVTEDIIMAAGYYYIGFALLLCWSLRRGVPIPRPYIGFMT